MGLRQTGSREIGTLCLIRFALMIVGIATTGCGVQESARRIPNPNRYIYVTAENLPGQCYRDLGPIEFDEPFAAATIDADGSNTAKHIRALAAAKYPGDVDAIINLHPEDNDAGTTVKVTGEAVEIENHTTVACALREAPPLLDSSAAAAAVGIGGTVAGGLLSGSPTGAMNTGGVSALAAGAGELMAHRANNELQRQQVMKQLVDQQREIRELQSERAHLKLCEDEERPLSDCDFKQRSNANAQSIVATPTDYQNLSLFELQKHAAEQRDYIAGLKQQISDMEWEMDNPTQRQ